MCVSWIWWNVWDYNSFNVITFSHKSQYNSLPQRSRKRTPTYSYFEFDYEASYPPSVLLYGMKSKTSCRLVDLSIMTHWMVRLQNISVSIWFLVILLLLTYWTEADCAQPFQTFNFYKDGHFHSNNMDPYNTITVARIMTVWRRQYKH